MEETSFYCDLYDSYLEPSYNKPSVANKNESKVSEPTYRPLNIDVRTTAEAVSVDHFSTGRSNVKYRKTIVILISTLIGIAIGSVCAGFTVYFVLKLSGEALPTSMRAQEMTDATTLQSSSVTGTTKSTTPTRHLNTTTLGTVRCSYCPNAWTRFGSSCYKIITMDESFADAQAYCSSLRADLVRVSDGTENRFLKTWLDEMNADGIWMGLTDLTKNGKWVWTSTKEQLVYNNWYPGQPNGNEEHCASFERQWQYTWHDYPCSSLKYFICEQIVS